jgi:Uma2 family endonuclease
MTTTDVRLWSVNDYHRMIEAEIITTEDKVELLDGQILEMSPQQPPHAATVQRTWKYLTRLLAEIADIRIQLPVTLYPNSEPEPDIAVVRVDSREYLDGHPIPSDIFLLIEVADWTLNKDRGVKARTYAKADIPEYWVLDVNARVVYVFRQPENNIYTSEFILDENSTISLVAFPNIEVETKLLFP